VHLAAFYPHPDAVAAWQVICAALLLLLITAGVVTARRERPYLLVGWLFFCGTLVPMLGLEGVGYQGKQGIADRYGYLPFVGLFVMFVWGVADWAQQKQIPAAILRTGSFALLVAICGVTYHQVGYWHDNVTLWSHTIQVTGDNFLAENNLGKALIADGHIDEGAAHFRRAIAIYPDDPVGNLNVGIYDQKNGNYLSAIEHYQKTLTITRDGALKAAALSNMATCYRALGDTEAAEHAETAAARLRR